MGSAARLPLSLLPSQTTEITIPAKQLMTVLNFTQGNLQAGRALLLVEKDISTVTLRVCRPHRLSRSHRTRVVGPAKVTIIPQEGQQEYLSYTLQAN